MLRQQPIVPAFAPAPRLAPRPRRYRTRDPRGRGRALLVALALAALGCEDGTGPLPSSVARQLAFSAEVAAGNSEIFVVNADGSALARVTDHPGEDVTPVWSADGRQLRFWSCGREAQQGCGWYEMSPSGSGVRLLLATVGGSGSAWSHDGRRLAYTARGDTTVWPWYRVPSELFVVEADGRQSTRLLRLGTLPCVLVPSTLEDEAFICEHVASPDWSPDDTRIAFVGEQRGPSRDPVRMSRLYVARADGSQLQLLGGAPATRERAPAWSPDGRRLALPARDASLPASGCPAQPLGLCFWPHVMNADGSGRALLTATVSLDAKLAWAPDGQRLAFVGAPIGGTAAEVGLYVIGVDGAGLRRVAPAPWGGAPAWNPVRP